MRRKISQHDARRLRKRVAEFEAQQSARLNRWASEWPSAKKIDTVRLSNTEWHIVRTARACGHAVVLVPRENDNVDVYACRLP